MADEGAEVEWDLSHGVAVVEVKTRKVDQPHVAKDLGAQLNTFLQDKVSDKLLLDLHHVSYMSSTGFGILLDFWKRAHAAGVQVRICEMDTNVRIGADIISLGRYVPIHDDKASAMAAFASEAGSK